MHQLRVVEGARVGEVTPLNEGKPVILGRGRDATLRFADPTLSRIHGEVVFESGAWVFRNKSRHGSLVNGDLVTTARTIAPGDALTLGSTKLVLERTTAVVTPTAAPEKRARFPLPGNGVEVSSEELARTELFAGIPPKTIESSLVKRHMINDQPPVWRRRFEPGEVICREGDYGSTAFFILEGTIDITVNTRPPSHNDSRDESIISAALRKLLGREASTRLGSESSRERMIPVDAPVHLAFAKPMAELKAGDIFGEMSCMSFYPRSATCTAGPKGAECLELLRSALDFVRDKGQGAYRERIEKNYRERTLAGALRNVPLLASMPEALIEFLRPRTQLVSFEPDATIHNEGTPSDAFYLIRLGYVKASQQRPGGEVVVSYLGPGQHFGEAGLLLTGKHTTTTTALDHVELIKITRADFELAAKQFPDFATALRRAAEEQQARKPTAIVDEAPHPALIEQGLYNAQDALLIDLERCTRCDECVRACADSHDGVTRLIRDGLRVDKYLVASACRACSDPVCMIGCPVGSIGRRHSLEMIIEDWCIGCGKCAQQCPYGNINMHPFATDGAKRAEVVNGGKGRAVVCDLCEGTMEPRCVYACPHQAAMRVEPRTFFHRLPLAG